MRVCSYIFAVGVTALAGAAQAQCPVSVADTQAGIYVDYGTYAVRYQLRPNGRTEEIEFQTAEDVGFRYVSQRGIMVHESAEMRDGRLVAGTGTTIQYSGPLLDIIPNDSWSVNTVVFPDGESSFNEGLSISTGPLVQTTIGACRLNSISVDLVARQPGVSESDLSRFTYFPDLGFAIFTGSGSTTSSFDAVTPMTISTEPPRTSGSAGTGGGGGGSDK